MTSPDALFDDETRLLLKAALAPGDAAIAAFRAWRARFDLDAIGYGARRLLPLAHANLRAAGCEDPLMGRIRGIRRFDWAHNQMLLLGAAHALSALKAAGIDTIVLKGAAMIAGWYRDAGLRPLGDVDILVPTAQARAAVETMALAGWRPEGTTARALCEVHLRHLNAWGFGRAGGQAVDLHWHMLSQANQTDADAAFWSRAAPAQIAGQDTRVLCAEDQLFHACAHGMQARSADRFSWPADAAWILRMSGSGFDWDRVVALARQTRLTLQLAVCLRFLRDELELEVSDSAIEELHCAPSSPIERAELRLRPLPPDRVGRVGTALLALQDFRRRTGDLVHRPAAAALLPWAAETWGLDGTARTLGYALAAACGRPAWLRRLWLRRPRQRLLARLDPATLNEAPLAFTNLTDDTLAHGWSEPEPNGRWTDGPEAVAAFRLPAAGRAIALHAVVEPFVAARHPKLTVDIWTNDVPAARWRFAYGGANSTEQDIVVPEGAIGADGVLVLTFVIRRPGRPAAIGHSTDRRRLGLFVRSLALRP